MARLQGKTAFVTGGTSGIGAEIVSRFAVEGARVAFCGRDLARGQEVASRSGAHFIARDVTDFAAYGELRGEVTETLGHLDILVNNAGSPFGATSFLKTTEQDIDSNVTLNIKAPWLLTQALLPAMGRGGSVINLTSIAAHRVGPTGAAYAVSKAAVLHMTRYAAAELGPLGIRVNSISPGFINTPIHAGMVGVKPERWLSFSKIVQRLFTSQQALDQPGTTRHIADAAVYLASAEAEFMTGSDLVLDGGLIWGGNLRGWRMMESEPDDRAE